jgi:hypothetical protein
MDSFEDWLKRQIKKFEKRIATGDSSLYMDQDFLAMEAAKSAYELSLEKYKEYHQIW